jgi:DNA-binding transcriptional ArsR family regulator
VLFSRYGNLRATVKSLILSSEQGLSGNEIGEIVQLSPRSFMHHFRELEGVLRKKHDGVYVYFSDEPDRYSKQSANRLRAGDVEKIGDTAAVKILVEYIKHPDIPTEELCDVLRERQGCGVSG